jgi:O-antigen/teichoic acid export membrane protein
MIKSAMFLLPIMVFLLCIAPDLICFLFGDKYEGAASPFRVYLLLLPVRTITFGAVLLATGQSRPILISSIITLIANAVLGWFAINWIGPLGAAFASVVSVYLVCVPFLIKAICSTLHTKTRNLFPWKGLGKILAVTVVPGTVTVAILAFLTGPHIVRLLVAGTIYGGLLLIIMQYVGLIRLTGIFEVLKTSTRSVFRKQLEPIIKE